MQLFLRISGPNGEVDVGECGLEVSRPEEARGAVGECERQRGGRVPGDEVISFADAIIAVVLKVAYPLCVKCKKSRNGTVQ